MLQKPEEVVRISRFARVQGSIVEQTQTIFSLSPIFSLKVSRKGSDARPEESLMFTLSRFARVHELQGSTDEATVSPANGGMRIVEK